MSIIHDFVLALGQSKSFKTKALKNVKFLLSNILLVLSLYTCISYVSIKHKHVLKITF